MALYRTETITLTTCPPRRTKNDHLRFSTPWMASCWDSFQIVLVLVPTPNTYDPLVRIEAVALVDGTVLRGGKARATLSEEKWFGVSGSPPIASRMPSSLKPDRHVPSGPESRLLASAYTVTLPAL